MGIATAIKILGIILCGASIIGSERLSKIEAKLRHQLQEPEKVLFGGKKVSDFLGVLGFVVHILFFVLLFLFFVYLSLGDPLPKQVADFLASIRQVNLSNIVKIILCFILTSLIIRPFIIMTSIGSIPPDFQTLYLWVIGILYLITTAILRIISFLYLLFDKQIQKRKIESTLVVLGIILSISGELIGNFIR